MKVKLRRELEELEKNSYASDQLTLPQGGIDCSEGCNPYGYPRGIQNVMKTFSTERFSPYPHSMAAYNGIVSFWSRQYVLKKENILLTDGSISALYTINNLFNIKGAKVLGIAPQFADFAANVRLLGMEYLPVKLDRKDGYKIHIESLLDRLNSKISLVYIDNPNNPTGQVISSEDIERLLKKAEDYNVCVVVDEAYGDFMPKENSAVRFLAQYENLIVVRTFSKGFGLAGLRAGYILAAESLIHCMNKISNPYQMGEISRELVGAALTVENQIAEHMESFARQKRDLRRYLGENLFMAETCNTVSICMVYHRDLQVDLYHLFLKQGILTVSGTDFDGLDHSCVRLRMPAEGEYPSLLRAVQEINSSV